MIPPFPRLSNARLGTRDNRSGMLVPMQERWGGGTILDLVKWMDVENSKRWSSRVREDGSTATYCDHAVADFLDQLHGANACPFPAWIWWNPGALAAWQDGESLRPIYRSTVRELGAPSLFYWMQDWGRDYGWAYFDTWQKLQDHCDSGGHAGVICTKRHTAVVLPSWVAPNAGGHGPLTWQAGINNWSHHRTKSWFYKFPETIFACWHPLED